MSRITFGITHVTWPRNSVELRKFVGDMGLSWDEVFPMTANFVDSIVSKADKNQYDLR